MIPVWEPVLDGNEERYVLDCLETNWISSLGRYITRFEEAFAAWCGMPHAVACSSGTAALHLSLVALGIGPGDEALLPDSTLIVSANTVLLAGAKPVLVDVDGKTWCLDPGKIEEKITPRARAIMAVHMYGIPATCRPSWKSGEGPPSPSSRIVPRRMERRSPAARSGPSGTPGVSASTATRS